MINAFRTTTGLHAIHMIRQKGLTAIETIGLCQTAGEAEAGIFQVADWAFDGRPRYGDIPICMKCSQVVTQLSKPPQPPQPPKAPQ